MSEPLSELAASLFRAHGPVSGEVLAEHFSISRAALQKRVQKLRGLGFDIDARPRRGYELKSMPDRMLSQTVRPHLEARWMGSRIEARDGCGSTNDEASALAVAGAHAGTVVVAESQSAGRGRLKRQWHSPSGKNIYLSAILRPNLPPTRVSVLTLASAVAVAQAIKSTCGVAATLKWPNDLYLDGRKVCGILTEMSADPETVRWIVVGIGINVNTETFPAPLDETATSLAIRTNTSIHRPHLAAAVLNGLETWHDECVRKGSAPVLQAWREWPNILGLNVSVTAPGTTEKITGVARDLDTDGALLLESDEGRLERIISGDVVPEGL